MTVSVAMRYKEGKKAMKSLIGGMSSFRMATFISVILVPIVSFMKPIMGVGSAITLLFQAYVCARIGISVQVKNVQKRLGKHKDITICDHVNLRIAPGELVAIIGGSGAVKSTLMNCISGYSKPTAREVLVNEVGL